MWTVPPATTMKQPLASDGELPAAASQRNRITPAWPAALETITRAASRLAGRHPDWLALAVLALAAAALLPQVVLLGKLPDHYDFWLQEFVHLGFLQDTLRAGELPLWNPHLAGGTPHLADPQSGVFYLPQTLLVLLLSPALVFRITIPLHFFLAGAATYGYGRSLDLSRPAALTSGLAYALAPHFAPVEIAMYIQQSSAWAPAILWALHAAYRRASPGLFAVAGGLWTLQLLQGYAQTWYFTGLVAGVVCLALSGAAILRGTNVWPGPSTQPPPRVPSGTDKQPGAHTTVNGQDIMPRPTDASSSVQLSRWRVVTGVRALVVAGPLLFPLFGLGLGAAQLVPSLDLLAQSHRQGGFSLGESAGPGKVAFLNLLGMAGPDAEVSGAFPGALVLALAVAGLLHGRGARTWSHAAGACAGLALALGNVTPLWGALYRSVPGFATMHMPHRTLFIWTLCLAVLAGVGMDALQRRRSVRSLGITLTIMAAISWLGLVAAGNPAEGRASLWRLAVACALVTALAVLTSVSSAAALTSLAGPGQRDTSRLAGVASRLATPALALLMALDLLSYNLPRLYGRFYPPDQVYAAPPAARWLQARWDEAMLSGAGPFRFAGARYSAPLPPEYGERAQDNRRLAFLPPNVPALYAGLESGDGYLAIRLAQSGDFYQTINDIGRNPRVLTIHDPSSRLLDLFNVRYFVTDSATSYPSVAGGGLSLVASDGTRLAPLREPRVAQAIELWSSLGDSTLVPDGEEVGELLVTFAGGAERRLAILAGEHTSEWMYDAPGVAGTVRHRKAPIARSQAQTGGYQSHLYRATFDLSDANQRPIESIRVRAVQPRARWNIDRILLHVPLASRFTPVYSDGPVRIWENQAVLPRAWWVPGYVVAPAGDVTFELLKDPAFDLRGLVVLEQPSPDLPQLTAGNASSGLPPTNQRSSATGASAAATGIGSTAGAHATERRTTANTQEITVDAPAAGLLVVSEMYERGWRASVDGRPAPVYRADGVFQAIPVPAGVHTVRLSYLPNSVLVGGAISASTLLVATSWAVWAWRHRRAATSQTVVA